MNEEDLEMNEEDLDTLIQIRQLLFFESGRNIKEYCGAANFKTEDAINTINKILKKYKVNLIEFQED